MKSLSYVALSIIFSVLMHSPKCLSQIPNGPYFGQTPPGLVPEVFAPDIISLDNRYEYGIAFSTDGMECSFGVTNNNWSWCDLYYTKQTDSVWSTPTLAFFAASWDGWQPFFSYDGEQFMFASAKGASVANIWVSQKEYVPLEQWGPPTKMGSPVNDPNRHDWRPNTTIDGTLYFSSGRSGGFGANDIYSSTPVGGQYLTVENLGNQVNGSSNDGSPFISPDGAYLLLESNRAGGYGLADIYITFRKADSTWTTPLNLGPTINTNQIDDLPWVSQDGKYLFFNRREGFQTTQQTDLYWVDMAALQLDVDNDSIYGPLDNCPFTYNPDQADNDSDGVGDVCDQCPGFDDLADGDSDSVPDSCDNCPALVNPGQEDTDLDGVGDSCDICPGSPDSIDVDADGHPDGCDNCPSIPNPGQIDTNSDGIGDACCCIGSRGDVNGDGADLDIVDLTTVVDFLFGVTPLIPCPNESDVNGDGSGLPDIVDLTFVVDWLFGAAPTLVPCP